MWVKWTFQVVWNRYRFFRLSTLPQEAMSRSLLSSWKIMTLAHKHWEHKKGSPLNLSSLQLGQIVFLQVPLWQTRNHAACMTTLIPIECLLYGMFTPCILWLRWTVCLPWTAFENSALLNWMNSWIVSLDVFSLFYKCRILSWIGK